MSWEGPDKWRDEDGAPPLAEFVSDTKPARRIVKRDFQPLDPSPLNEGRCPVCLGPFVHYSRAHVVPKGHGGDDVPENAAWICGDGVMGCHGCLTHRNRVIGHPILPDEVARRFVVYCRETVPMLGVYADGKKFDGWLESYYLGSDALALEAAREEAA